MLVAACSGPPGGTALPPTEDTNDVETPTPAAGVVTRADFATWPFVADSGQLICAPSGKDDGRLLVRMSFGDDIEYALNGTARDFGFPELDTTVIVWRASALKRPARETRPGR